MAKDKLKAALEQKGPDALRLQATTGRQAINPVDILAAAAAPTPSATEETAREQRTEEEFVISDEEKRTEKTKEKREEKEGEKKVPGKRGEKRSVKNIQQISARKRRTGKPRIHSERDIHALLAVEKRATERYSFEIYVDQKEDIQRVCESYEESTGKKLSASRFIREVLDYFLPGALEAFAKEDEE